MHTRSEYDANRLQASGLDDRHTADDRKDWLMAQFIDGILDYLAAAGSHEVASGRMHERGVTAEVQRRVLAGHGARRHKEKKVMQ
jgi:hypothetical protein